MKMQTLFLINSFPNKGYMPSRRGGLLEGGVRDICHQDAEGYWEGYCSLSDKCYQVGVGGGFQGEGTGGPSGISHNTRRGYWGLLVGDKGYMPSKSKGSIGGGLRDICHQDARGYWGCLRDICSQDVGVFVFIHCLRSLTPRTANVVTTFRAE